MLYNSATFMSTPWETIIKVYRQQLENRNFSTVKFFLEDFLEFLRSKKFYTTDIESKKSIYELADTLLNGLVEKIYETHSDLFLNLNEPNKDIIIDLLSASMLSYTEKFKNENICDEFLDYTYDEFHDFSNDVIADLIEKKLTSNGYNITDDWINLFSNLIYTNIKRKETFTNYTGLIFTGFGEDEIYPSLVPLNISFSIENRLRCFIDEVNEVTITNDNGGAVRPFAQTDVIDTILSGIAPKLDETYLKNFEFYFKKYNEEILNLIGDRDPILKKQIEELDVNQLVGEYSQQNLMMKRTHFISPLMDAVSTLSKEDLAEMAESLIYLTYLKRRITFTEESVGGPVDVAIISKGDGFIWIKRKHYFKPELNQYFFDNYFNA